jgi:hypothetical protein
MKTKILGILCLALSCTSITQAQPIMPATIPDVTAGLGSNVTNINCDALELQLSGNRYTLSAVTWDNVASGPTEYLNMQVTFKGATVAGSISRSIGNLNKGKRPDIMIGHTANGYYIGLIYEISNTIELRVYQATLTTSPSINLALTLLTTQVLETRLGQWPHIDGYTDANTLINGAPTIPEFAASWHYNGSSPGITMVGMGVVGNIEPPISTTVIPWLVWGAEYNSDITAYTDISTGDKCAAFVWTQNGISTQTELIISRAPVTATISQEWAPEYNFNPYILGVPRIESQSQYNNTLGRPEWMVVCPKLTSSGVYEINEYNSLSCQLCGATQTVSTPFGTGNSYTQTAISAGTGMSSMFGGSGKFNSAYQAIMHATGNNIVNADNIVPSGGALFAPYFDVNNSAIPSPPLAFTTPVAVSSTSNTGNYMMAAWWDGTNVKYKLVYDSIGVTPHYRSTAVNNTETLAEVALYPNPATNTISITGIDNSTYVIKDVIGHVIASGVSNEKQAIDISAFAPGNYFVEVNKGDKSSTLRFTKQ